MTFQQMMLLSTEQRARFVVESYRSFYIGETAMLLETGVKVFEVRSTRMAPPANTAAIAAYPLTPVQISNLVNAAKTTPRYCTSMLADPSRWLMICSPVHKMDWSNEEFYDYVVPLLAWAVTQDH